MKAENFTFPTVDGVDLYVRAWLVDQPKAIVQILHGMAEHGARYGRLAQALASAGFSTYAHDHRGHGRSVSEGTPPGHIADSDSWNRIVEDAHGVNREIAKRHPGVPIIVLGHSMGSFILQQLLFEHPRDMIGAALSASNGKPPAIATLGKMVARIERARVGKRNPSPILQRLTFGEYNKAFAPNRTEFDWLSRDPTEVDAYVADPLCGFAVSTQVWIDMLQALDRIAKPSNVAKVPKDKPLYLFAGDRDPVGDFGKGMKRLHDAYKRAAIFDVRLKLYPEGRHEMLNETNRQQVMDDFIAWCNEIVASQS
ncbi:MAG: lysophospholipase [Myxococcales bacterium]|jgi:alpha-beta hydrolase superfamily lysophospholipase